MTWEAVEAAIVERLEEKLGGTVKAVVTAAEFAGIEEGSQVTPAAAVIYGGYAPTQSVGIGKVQEIEQTWLVVISCRSAYHTRTRRGAREDSAPIVRATMEALLGWRPNVEGEGPLRLAAAPEAQFSDAGFAYYPIGFTNRRTYRGTD